MKRLIGILIFATCFAGSSFAEDLDYFRSVLTADNVEAKRTVLLQIRDLHSEAAARIATQALTDRNEMVRATAASSVSYLPAAEAVTVLAPLLNDKAPFVRTEAAYALGRVGDSSAVRPLIGTLQNDGEKAVKAAAVIALGQIGDASAIEPLTAVFKKSPSEENEFIRRSAAASVGQIADAMRKKGPQFDLAAFRNADAVLIKALNNSKETDDTRRESAGALGFIGDPAALPALRSHLNAPDNYLVDLCRAAIARIEGGK